MRVVGINQMTSTGQLPSRDRSCHVKAGGIGELENLLFGSEHSLACALLRERQPKCLKDFLHVFPDPLAILMRIVTQYICGMIGGHELDGVFFSGGSVVVEESAYFTDGCIRSQ